jgi:hypothetical protein
VLICDSSPSPLCHTVVVMEKASISKQVTKSTKGNARKREGGGMGTTPGPRPAAASASASTLRCRFGAGQGDSRGRPPVPRQRPPSTLKTSPRAAATRRLVTPPAAAAAWNPGEEATRCRLRPAMVPPVRPAPRPDCYLLITPRNGGTPLGGSPAALGAG